MNTTITNWEDDENNRDIEFSVEYSVENDRIQIRSFTPQRVSFRCPQSGEVLRQIGVHTQTGRNLLTRQLQSQPNQVEQLTTVIAEKSQLLAIA